jgi:hypothetical protein
MGRVVGAFGLKGWLKVNPFTEAPDGLEQFDRWLLRTSEGWQEMALEDFALHSKGPDAMRSAKPRKEASSGSTWSGWKWWTRAAPCSARSRDSSIRARPA